MFFSCSIYPGCQSKIEVNTSKRLITMGDNASWNKNKDNTVILELILNEIY